MLITSCTKKPIGKTIAVITFVDHPVLNTIQNSFESYLTELVANKYSINWLRSNAQGRVENLQDISQNILQKNPELIVTISTPVSQSLMRETNQTQKIVFTFVTNPADLGDELTRTNSTGLSDAVNYYENIELIKKLFGKNVIIGMLYNPNEANSVHGINTVETILAKSVDKLRLVKATVVAESDIPTVTSQLAKKVDVIYVGGDNTVVGAIPIVVNEALKKKIPVIASDEGSIKTQAIAGVSVDYEKLGRETAKVVKQILDGTMPKQIPRIVLRGDKLILNMKAARLFNFVFPDSIIQSADQVIE
jgi:putative ABC transport system substrate-binding protein